MTTAKQSTNNPVTLSEDLILDGILEASETELMAEQVEEGRSPDEVVAAAYQALARAGTDCARRRLENAKASVAAWKAAGPNVVSLADRERQRHRLADMIGKAPNSPGMMMAARKATALSERDKEGLLDDLADLERLEREEGE